MDEPASDVGARIRRIRQQAGLTMQQVADRAGVSRMTVAQIENGAVNPTVGSVSRIAAALDVPVVAMFMPEPAPDVAEPEKAQSKAGAFEVIHADDRRQYLWRAKKFEYDILVPEHRPVEVHLMRYKAGTEIPFDAHGGDEVAIVVSGDYEMAVGDRTVRVTAGDSVYLSSPPDVTVRCLASGEMYWVAAAV